MPTYTTRNNLYKPSPTDAISVAGAGQELATGIDDKIDRLRSVNGTKVIHSMGMYEEKASDLPGYIVVDTDIPFVSGTDKMFRFNVRGYTYWPYNNVIDFSVNFYMLNGGVFSPDFNNKGSMNVREVRLCRKNSNNNFSLLFAADIPVAAGGGVWRYPKIVVDGWVSWSTEIPDAQFRNVSISRIVDPFGGTPTHTTVHAIDADEWKLITLESGWVPYDGGGTAGHATPRLRRIGEHVIVEGLVKNGSLTGTIFTLPQGFRHTGGPLIYNLHCGGASGRVDVNSTGPVYANGLPNNSYLSLNGIIIPVGNTLA